MDGRLKDHPLSELIHEISDARLSGALRLAFERVRGVVYFEGGRVVAAASNLRAFRLAEVVRASGLVEPSRLYALAGENASDERAAAVLLQADLLDEPGLRRARERQTAEVLRDLLRRPEGEWNYDPRVRLDASLHTSVNAAQLLVEHARELAPETLSERMRDEQALAPAADAVERADAVALSPAEGFVLSRVQERTTLGEVLSVAGLPEEETRRAAYALALAGLVSRGRRGRALPTEMPRAKADAPAQQAPQAPQAPAEPAPQPPPEAEADPRDLIEELLARGGGETHYSVLGVARSASGDELKRTYYSLARRLHPDRLRRVADADTGQRIDAAFAKISRAYEVLKDANRRAAYDLKLDKQGASQPRQAPPPPDAARAHEARADSPQKETPRADAHAGTASGAEDEAAKEENAERKFRQGLGAYARGDFMAARLLLGEAARLSPKSASYRAHYGRVLAREKATQRQAESELLAAISLDALDASIRVMLAELYAHVGLRRKAAAHLERALALEPSNAAARAMLREINR